MLRKTDDKRQLWNPDYLPCVSVSVCASFPRWYSRRWWTCAPGRPPSSCSTGSASRWLQSESIEWFTEYQAFTYDFAPPLPPSPPNCRQTHPLSQCAVELTDGGGGGGEPNITTARRTGPLEIIAAMMDFPYSQRKNIKREPQMRHKLR